VCVCACVRVCVCVCVCPFIDALLGRTLLTQQRRNLRLVQLLGDFQGGFPHLLRATIAGCWVWGVGVVGAGCGVRI
jgi:hypothetical protein